MRHLLVAAALLAACGGSSGGGGGGPDQGGGLSPPPPSTAVPLQAGVYQASTTSGVRALSAAGPALATTLIVREGGVFSLLLPGYDYVTGGLLVRPDGSLSVSGQEMLVSQSGTSSPASIIGVFDGTTQTLTATVNGTKSFLLPLNATITAQSFTIAQMVGNYISTSTSDGTWVSLALAPAGPPYDPSMTRVADLQGFAFASQADAQAADLSVCQWSWSTCPNALYHVSGTLTHMCDQNEICGGPIFGAGFGFLTLSGGVVWKYGGTGGLAYVTDSGFVALTANPPGGAQFSAAFVKQ